MSERLAATFLLALLCLGATCGAAVTDWTVLEGQKAFGSWQVDRPGTTRLIRPQDLPRPGTTPSVARGPHVVPRPANAMPQVPPGFKIEPFAERLSGPRIIRVAPNGDIFVAETRAGRIRVLRAPEGASRPTANETFARGLNRPFGIAFFPSGDNPQWIYIANAESVVRFP
jgi:glucose/arabinose dehydrogenase